MDGKTRRESAREEREKLKGLSFGKKLEYIWEYYKAVFAIILFAAVIIAFIVRLISGLGTVTELSVAWINAQESEGQLQSMEEEFRKFGGWEDGKQKVVFDDSYAIHPGQTDPMTAISQAKITTDIQAKMLDVMVMTEDVYKNYLEMGAFVDMKEVLGKEFSDSHQELLTEEGYALKLTDSIRLKSLYGEEPVYLAVTVRAKNTDNVEKFVKYLLS